MSRLHFSRGLFPTTKLYAFLLSPIYVTRPAHLVLLDLIKHVSVSSTDHDAPHYAVFSSLLLHPPSWTQISPAAPHS